MSRVNIPNPPSLGECTQISVNNEKGYSELGQVRMVDSLGRALDVGPSGDRGCYGWDPWSPGPSVHNSPTPGFWHWMKWEPCMALCPFQMLDRSECNFYSVSLVFPATVQEVACMRLPGSQICCASGKTTTKKPKKTEELRNMFMVPIS